MAIKLPVDIDFRGGTPSTAHIVIVDDDNKVICDTLNGDLCRIDEEPDDYGSRYCRDGGSEPAMQYIVEAVNAHATLIAQRDKLLAIVKAQFEREYNPFEPDNQSANWHKLKAAIALVEGGGK